MSPDNDSAKQADRYWALVLAVIVIILALLGISPLINDSINKTSISRESGLISVSDIGSDSDDGVNESAQKKDAPKQETRPGEDSPNLDIIGDVSIWSPSTPADPAIEEKITRDFKESIDQLTESNQMPAAKPSPGRRGELTTEELEEQTAATIRLAQGLAAESMPAPALIDESQADEDDSADREFRDLRSDDIESDDLTEFDKTDSSTLPAIVAEPEPETSTAGSRQQLDNSASDVDLSSIRDVFSPNINKTDPTASAIASSIAPTPTVAAGADPVQQFLAEQSSLENLSFKPAEGYWANTYVPGDPLLRQLAASLQGTNQQTLIQSIEPNWQPFDAPENSALALYLSADQKSVTQPSRLRIQVGLKGSSRQGGQRSTLNLAVVLDLSQTMTDFSTIGSLLSALQQAQQPGDRFSLIAATQSAELLVSPNQFRFGPLQLALKRLSDEHSPAPLESRSASSLAEAIRLAARQVRQDDDPNAVLGSSLVLLVTPNSLADELNSLSPIVHRNAVEGVFLSIVGLNSSVADDAIQRLVLAGQGNRRRLTHPEQAKTLVDQELYASSRAVARAVRLRIRLADGVKLVDILGSRPLQEPEAQRVREAEQSIDQRMARNLGIKADRGNDEEGIQIVIPHFYAGDSHVILLDVVAERAGVIAEVSARYKDLVALGNGVSHAQLMLDDISQAPGPLQRNVLKNLLAFQLTEASRQAGQQLMSGNTRQSLQTLLSVRRLFSAMREYIAAWANDRELLHDEHLLDAYLQQLADQSFQPQQTAAALRYLAFRKLIPGREEAL